MPARLHAVVVARSGARSGAQLQQTLAALSAQTRRPDAVTVVVCGDASVARERAVESGLVEGVIQARTTTSFATAVSLALARIPDDSAVWLLAQGTDPDPEALAELAGALERSPSAALAAPKLVRHDDEREIVSFGVTMTTLGRTFDAAAGELDQGQHDGADESLGSDVRGILLRREVRAHLAIDDALAGADEGLDLGVRARLGGGRVVLAPGARIRVREDGPAAPAHGAGRRAYASRVAQLHRRLAYAPAVAVPLHWITLLPLALWRTIGHLIGKRPASVLPEWGAAFVAMFRFGAVARSRRRIRGFRTATWANIAPLRVTRGQLRRRLDDGHGSERGAVSELRFFSGGGAWAVLAALVVGIVSFTSLLAWPALAGGGLLPLRDTVGALWRDAGWGLRGIGAAVVGPADPFAAVVAVLGSLWPASPSFALVLLWILALPLAVLGGWFAATRITDRSGLRILLAVAWALAPTFLTALVDGRPAAVLLHLLLPWLLHTAAVAHRSWGAAGAASIVFAAVIACAPSLAPALVVLWVLALIVLLALRRLHGAVRVLWMIIPAAAMFLPLVLSRLRTGELLALLADPAQVWIGSQATADAAGRLLLATGFPTADRGGWSQLLDPSLAAWAPILLAPIAVLAVLSALARRWWAGIAMLVVALTGFATAFLAVGIEVSFVAGDPVAIWPGTGLSLAWLGIIAAAGVALDSLVLIPRLRTASALVAGLALVVCAVPALSAFHTDRSVVAQGKTSTLPALVEAMTRGGQDVATLVITPLDADRIGTRVIWGASETLGAQTTLLGAATAVRGTDIGPLAVDLISGRDFDAASALADLGIRFVIIAEPDGESDGARALGLEAAIELDQRPEFVKAGVLWRLDDAIEVERPGLTSAQSGIARGVATTQLAVILIALLLSVPTRASRRAARSVSRVVGRAAREPQAPLPRAHGLEPEEAVVVAPAAADAAVPDAPDAGENGRSDEAGTSEARSDEAGTSVGADAVAVSDAEAEVVPAAGEAAAEESVAAESVAEDASVDRAVPTDGTAPVADETGPVADEAAPFADEAAPAADETAPVADEIGPTAPTEETAPTDDEHPDDTQEDPR